MFFGNDREERRVMFFEAMIAMGERQGFRPKKRRRKELPVQMWLDRDCGWRTERIAVLGTARGWTTVNINYEVDVPPLGGRAQPLPLIGINAVYKIWREPFVELPARGAVDRYIAERVFGIESHLVWFSDYDTPGKCLSRLEADLLRPTSASPHGVLIREYLESLPGDHTRVPVDSDGDDAGDAWGDAMEALLRGLTAAGKVAQIFPGAVGGSLSVKHEKVVRVGVVREPGFLYFLDNDTVKRTKRRDRDTQVEEVTRVSYARVPGYRYYLDNDGDISRAGLG